MQNSDQEKQDQRTNSVMEDSNAMTIEFLRARLLSERSVSKSARQRADELAKRVAELEEQLKIVSLQRKKAEKATVDVLAILESNGISDISEGFDSSSDQETPCESKVGNNSNKEGENSVDSKLRRNESEELSGSDYDFSPVSQRALSWKGRKDAKHSTEKYKDSYLRRRSSFASSGSSSPKHHIGKSCRQIRRRESKSVVEECKTDPMKVVSQENGAATSLEVDNRSEILRGGSEAQEEQYLPEGIDSGCLENGKNVTKEIDINGHGGDKDMEKALADQAQLIGRYVEMEKAQREWEERFRENNSSTPDSCDPGNQSDVTEEREEIKAPVQCLDATVNSQVQEAKSEVYTSDELSKTESNGFLLPSNSDMQCIGDKKCTSTPASEATAPDFAFPMSNEGPNQESLNNDHYLPSHRSHHHLNPHGSPGNQSSLVVSSKTGNSSGREVTRNHKELYALVPHETSNGFSEVLETLKCARLSLQQKISSLPLTESESVQKAIEPSLPAAKVWDRLENPVGCSGLFRVPTDYAVEATKANFLVSGSRPSLANYNSVTGLGVIAGDQIVSTSYMDTRSTFSADNFLATGDQFLTGTSVDIRSSYSTDDRFLTSQHPGTRSRISTVNPTFDGNLDAGLPLSRQYSNPAISSYPDLMPQVASNERLSTFLPSRSVEMPTNLDVGLPFSSQYAYPTSSSDPDLMPQIPVNRRSAMPQLPVKEGFPTFRPSRSVGMSPANHLPFCSDQSRPNMYR